jgi:arginine/lysine/ornithine decarboxylase
MPIDADHHLIPRIRHSIRFWAAIGLLGLLLIPPPAYPNDPTSSERAPRDAGTAEASTGQVPGLLKAPRETLSPRLLEIRDRLETDQAQLEKLAAAYQEAGSGQEALRIQRQIHELKTGTEIAVLEIQLRYARLESDTIAATRLEAELEEMRNPVLRVHVKDPAGRRGNDQ